jgi:S-adenosylmethionine:tRNA ribosyltransferase-isomerase
MNRAELLFHRPEKLAASRPAEARGRPRDTGRLLVSSDNRHQHTRFSDLSNHLQPGDLLVVNRSATLPASLPARGKTGSFTLNLSTNYGSGLWLVEPRHSPIKPGPVPWLSAGDKIHIEGVEARLLAPFPGLPRLWYIQTTGDVCLIMNRSGRPIQYGYLDGDYQLDNFQTIFSAVPGSAEMPSAAYPITKRVLGRLREKGVQLAGILLHTGVSSLEIEDDEVDKHPMYPEPFKVPGSTAHAVNVARKEGRRVIAVGTTVVRALESAWDGEKVRASSGFTRLFVNPRRGVFVVDGLLTGLHDPATSHLAMLYAIAGQDTIREAYTEAVNEGYRWHEFGDSHLIFG